jgi:hypothetical protein
MDRGHLVGHVGAGIGFCAWSVATIALCAAFGDWGGAWQVGVPGLFLSLGLWQLVTLAGIGARRAFGPDSAEARLTLLGALALALAILLWLLDRWGVPRLCANPELATALARLGSSTTAPVLLLYGLPPLGVLLLARPVASVLRGGERD